MKQYLALARRWLPPVGALTCLLLVARVLYVGLTSAQANLSTSAWIGAFLLLLSFGLYRRMTWARWIAAALCLLLGALCLVFLIMRFFPPGLFGSTDAPIVERPSFAITFLLLVPPVLLLPLTAWLLLPGQKPDE